MRSRKLLIVVILAVTILSNASSAFCFSVNDQFVLKAAVFNQRFFRTELYFGTDKNDGTEVSVEEWNKFLADEVTPRFPDGFTVLEG